MCTTVSHEDWQNEKELTCSSESDDQSLCFSEKFHQRRATFEGNTMIDFSPRSVSNPQLSNVPPSSNASQVARIAALFQAGNPKISDHFSGRNVASSRTRRKQPDSLTTQPRSTASGNKSAAAGGGDVDVVISVKDANSPLIVPINAVRPIPFESPRSNSDCDSMCNVTASSSETTSLQQRPLQATDAGESHDVGDVDQRRKVSNAPSNSLQYIDIIGPKEYRVSPSRYAPARRPSNFSRDSSVEQLQSSDTLPSPSKAHISNGQLPTGEVVADDLKLNSYMARQAARRPSGSFDENGDNYSAMTSLQAVLRDDAQSDDEIPMPASLPSLSSLMEITDLNGVDKNNSSFLFEAMTNYEREIALSLNGSDDVKNCLPPAQISFSDIEWDSNASNDFVHVQSKNCLKSLLKPTSVLKERESVHMETSGIDVVFEHKLCVVEPLREVAFDDGVHIFNDGHFFYEDPQLSAMTLEKEDTSASHITYSHAASKVKFSEQPSMVYSTHSINDYDRRNEDIDPVSSSAEYELEKRLDRMDIFDVELNKGSRGLGISILGMGVGTEMGVEKLGIFIKSLAAGGAAEQAGCIKVYDQIVEVDGISLVGVNQVFASQVLRSTKGTVHFKLGRDKDPSNSDIVRLVRQSISDIDETASLAKPEHLKSTLKNDHLDINKNSNGIIVNMKEKLKNTDTLAEEASTTDSVGKEDQEAVLRRCLDAEEAARRANQEALALKAEMNQLKCDANHFEQMQRKFHQMEELMKSQNKEVKNARNKLADSQEVAIRVDLAQKAAEDNRNKYKKCKRLLKDSEELNNILQRQADEREVYFNNLVRGLRDRIIVLEEEVDRRKLRKKSDEPNESFDEPALPIVTAPEIIDVESVLPLNSKLLLDVSLAKSKANLCRIGGLAGRKLPTQSHISSVLQADISVSNPPTSNNTSSDPIAPITSSKSSAAPTTSSASSAAPSFNSKSSAEPATSSTSSTAPTASSKSSAAPTTSSASSAAPVTSSLSSAAPTASSMSSTAPTASSKSSAVPTTNSTSSAAPAISSTSSAVPVTISASISSATMSPSLTTRVTSSTVNKESRNIAATAIKRNEMMNDSKKEKPVIHSSPKSSSSPKRPFVRPSVVADSDDGDIQLVAAKPLVGFEDTPSWLIDGKSAIGGNVNTLHGLDELDRKSSRNQSYDFGASRLNEWSHDDVKHWLLEEAGLEKPDDAVNALKGLSGADFAKLDNAQLKHYGVNHATDRNILRRRLKELNQQASPSRLRKLFHFRK